MEQENTNFQEVAEKPCEECSSGGLPGWMATFADLVTLLLTFFILLYAMSKQDEVKYKAVAGSIREAFGGNTKSFGEVPVTGKSPYDSPTVIESLDDVKPFPIDFLTTEGILDKLEINRATTEELKEIKKSLQDFNLTESVNIYEISEGIKVRIKDKIFFKQGSVAIDSIQMEVFERLINLLQKEKDWKIFVEGHASSREQWQDKSLDAFSLSAKRAEVVSRYLIKRGVVQENISSVFYGDSRPLKNGNSSRVEFLLRKVDLLNNPTEKYVNPY